jgi:hypothetical protein
METAEWEEQDRRYLSTELRQRGRVSVKLRFIKPSGAGLVTLALSEHDFRTLARTLTHAVDILDAAGRGHVAGAMFQDGTTLQIGVYLEPDPEDSEEDRCTIVGG